MKYLILILLTGCASNDIETCVKTAHENMLSYGVNLELNQELKTYTINKCRKGNAGKTEQIQAYDNITG